MDSYVSSSRMVYYGTLERHGLLPQSHPHYPRESCTQSSSMSLNHQLPMHLTGISREAGALRPTPPCALTAAEPWRNRYPSHLNRASMDLLGAVAQTQAYAPGGVHGRRLSPRLRQMQRLQRLSSVPKARITGSLETDLQNGPRNNPHRTTPIR